MNHNRTISKMLLIMQKRYRNGQPNKHWQIVNGKFSDTFTEYGVHWNFFFTLGLLPPFVALLQTIPSGKQNPTTVYTALSLLVVGIYQIILKTTPLEEFVLIGDRHKYGLLGMNKEGASSFVGYLAIFLAGTASGTYVLPRDYATGTRQSNLLKKMMGWAAFWVLSYYVVSDYRGLGIGVSRRLANLPYVLWVSAFNTSQLGAFYLVETLLLSKRQTGIDDEKEAYKLNTPKILDAFNRNGLVVFLVVSCQYTTPDKHC